MVSLPYEVYAEKKVELVECGPLAGCRQGQNVGGKISIPLLHLQQQTRKQNMIGYRKCVLTVYGQKQ